VKDKTMETKEHQLAPEESLQDGASAASPQHATAEGGSGAATKTSVEAEDLLLADLKTQLEQQRQEAQEHLDHLQRLQAEFSNYRRRMAQESLQAANRGKQEVVAALLPIFNNFRLALQHVEQDANAVRQGVQLIWQQCEEFLRGQSVEPIATVGHPFDPTKHEALSTVPATQETPANTIVAEINAGYMMNGHLLRPAQVVVAKAEEPASPPQTEDTPASAEPEV
jgi:molecular chaperone GrpE